MTTYNIDRADPLRTGFTIAPGGFNGPGGALSDSPLRLYGRGALEWGESVDENMLRTLENFNGSTPPPFPLAGQIWFNTKFYWLDTVGLLWYRLDPDTPGAWVDITVSVSGGAAGTNVTPPSPVVGSYWYTALAPTGLDAFGNPIEPTTLYRYDTAFAQVATGWIKRTSTSSAVAPVNGVDYPERQLLIWDEFLDDWVAPPVSFVAPFASPPPNPSTGAFWWDTTNDQLNIWDGAAWQGIILASGTQPMDADLNMGGFKIVSLGTPTLAADAATKAYVDGLASTAVLDTLYLRLNDTNNPSTDLTWDVNLRLPVQAYPLANSNNAASITYVNGLATSLGTPGAGGFASIHSGGGAVVQKVGDIYINPGTGRIWIAISAGAPNAPTNYAGDGSDATWKQVFPALYA